MWYALGFCYYRVGNLAKARLSFEKTLELDSKNAMALTSLGIIELVGNSSSFESRKRAISFFTKAFDVLFLLILIFRSDLPPIFSSMHSSHFVAFG
jgi:tetratricopeptide (TPR) repeat protein